MYKSAIVGFSYLVGLICASLFGIGADVVIGLTAALCGIALLFFGHKSAAASLISAGCGFVIMAAFVFLNYAPVTALNGTECEIKGTFLEKSYNANDTGCYIIEAEINGVKTKISLFGEDADAQYGDKVTARVRLSSFSNAEFSMKAYYLSDGIFLKAFALSEITVEKAENPPLVRYIYNYREHLLSRINIALNGENGALVSAMFLGEKSGLSAVQDMNIRTSGLSHMTAVSGMHLSVIVTLVMVLLDAFLRDRRVMKYILLLTIIAAFAVLFKFSPSVLRASFMMLVYHSAPLFNRRADPLNSVGLAVLAITIVSPFAAYDAGLLLSVSGTIGAGWLGSKINKRLRYRDSNLLKSGRTLRQRIKAIAGHEKYTPDEPDNARLMPSVSNTMGGKVNKPLCYKNNTPPKSERTVSERLKTFVKSEKYTPDEPFDAKQLYDREKHANPMRDTLVSSVCALICVMPLSAVYFGGISLWSVISGLLIQPFFAVCLGAMVLFTFTGGVSNLLLLIAGVCSKIMNSVIAFFGAMEGAWVDLSGEFVPPLLLLSSLYIVLFFARVKSRKFRALSAGFAAAVLVCTIGTANSVNSDIAVLDVLSDGDGGAAVVGDNGEYAVIVVGNGKKTASDIYSLLKEKSVRTIKCLDLTRLDSGISAYSKLSESFDIQLVLISESAARDNKRYKFFPDATIAAQKDTVIMTDKVLTIEGKVTYLTLKGTTISVSRINEGDFRGGIAVMNGWAKDIDLIGSINVYIDKKQKNLNAQSVNAYETPVKFYFKEGGYVAEDYG